MDRKRTIPLTFLGYLLLLGGMTGILLYFRVAGIFHIQFILSIICGVGIIKRYYWARLLTIYVEVGTILFYCLWFSPFCHQNRIEHRNSFYDKAKVDRVEVSSIPRFPWGILLLKSFVPMLIILFLSKSEIRKEFENKPIAKGAM
jgi:hypothetical protein